MLDQAPISNGESDKYGEIRTDSLITAAVRALAANDPFGALSRVALRDDAVALALRGIAMAQLGGLACAKLLLRRAARAFGVREAVARTRCVVAEAEIALASHDLGWPARTLHTACATLEAHGDHANTTHARCPSIRRLLLTGRLNDAEAALAVLTPAPLPPALRVTHALVVAGITIRRLQTDATRTALSDTECAARQTDIPTLTARTECVVLTLNAPTMRLISRDEECILHLDDIEALFASGALVVDACRLAIQQTGTIIPFATRPVLFALARALAEAWPEDETRDALTARASRTRHPDESHRMRLRVETGRLHTILGTLGTIKATRHGFVLQPHATRAIVVLAQPVAEQHATMLTCLANKESWPGSALALALNVSQRTIRRTLNALTATGKMQSFGRGRACRWVTPPLPGFTTILLLPVLLPSDQDEDRVTESNEPHMRRFTAEVVRECGPFPGVENVSGVTYDSRHIWFATGGQLKELNPDSGKTQRSISIPAHAGAAFGGQHLFQIAEDRIQKIDPQTGTVLAMIPTPGAGGDPDLAWAKGTLWVSHYRERKVRRTDPDTGKVLHTIEPSRFVIGVTWVDGRFWHGIWEGGTSEVRHIDPQTGEVLEQLDMPAGVNVPGLESDGADQFFCGDGTTGKIRAV